MPFWKTNKKTTDYSVLKLFRIFLPANLYIWACAVPLTHTILPPYSKREMFQRIFKYTGAICKCVALISNKVSYAFTSVYRLTHTCTHAEHHVFLICLQYLTTDTQLSTKCFYVFPSHDIILSSIILYVARITEIFADLELYLHTEQFLYRFYVPLDCFVFECFTLSTTFLTIRALTAMQFQQTAKPAF